MDEHGQCRHHPEAEDARHDVVADVNAEFHMRVSLDHLEQHAAKGGDHQHAHQEHEQRDVLADHAQAQGQRRGIVDLVELGLALLPYQQTAVEGDQDHGEEAETAFDHLDDMIGDREDGVLVE